MLPGLPHAKQRDRALRQDHPRSPLPWGPGGVGCPGLRAAPRGRRVGGHRLKDFPGSDRRSAPGPLRPSTRRLPSSTRPSPTTRVERQGITAQDGPGKSGRQSLTVEAGIMALSGLTLQSEVALLIGYRDAPGTGRGTRSLAIPAREAEAEGPLRLSWPWAGTTNAPALSSAAAVASAANPSAKQAI